MPNFYESNDYSRVNKTKESFEHVSTIIMDVLYLHQSLLSEVNISE
jgi:hypothetical protein